MSDADPPRPTGRIPWQPRRWSATALRREAKRHARLVAALKIGLPVAAVALVAVLVSWPYVTSRDAPGLRLTYASVDQSADGTVAMTNARYLGTDRKGQSFTITAERAEQDPDRLDHVVLSSLAADISLDDGSWLSLRARRGLYRPDARTLDLEGDVSLYADSGYELRTERARIDLGAEIASGDAPVEGQGPLGHLVAGGFELDVGGDRLSFHDGVTLTLYPAVEE
ncbi:MAG: LPS export ABC transporter periplasmic protein LptC [Alphaproteobacteria bacterium]